MVEGSLAWQRVVTAAQPSFDTVRARLAAARASPVAFASPRYVTTVVGIALAYFGASLIGASLRFTGNVTAFWPPVGVGIALLLYFGLRFWPAILIGDLLADIPNALPVGPSLGQTVGNVLEVTVAVILIRRLVGTSPKLERLPTVARLAAILLAATAVSASIGTLSLRLGGVIDGDEAPRLWRTWWLADSCGALVVVPLALAWAGGNRRPRWDSRRRIECAVLVIAMVAVNLLASEARQPLSYIVFPTLVWAAMRFGTRGATFGLAVTALTALWATAHRLGPFTVHSIDPATLRLQLYLDVTIASTLFVSVLAEERRAAALALAASRARLLDAGDTARRQLERNLHDGAQQRLVALALRLARSQHEDDLAQTRHVMQASAHELAQAIEELREVAQGIHPPVLTEHGLG